MYSCVAFISLDVCIYILREKSKKTPPTLDGAFACIAVAATLRRCTSAERRYPHGAAKIERFFCIYKFLERFFAKNTKKRYIQCAALCLFDDSQDLAVIETIVLFLCIEAWTGLICKVVMAENFAMIHPHKIKQQLI